MDFDTMYGLMNPQGPDQGAIGRALQTPEGQAAIAREMAAKGIRPQSFMQQLETMLGLPGDQASRPPPTGMTLGERAGSLAGSWMDTAKQNTDALVGSARQTFPPNQVAPGNRSAGEAIGQMIQGPQQGPAVPPGLLAAMAPPAEGMEGRKPSGPLIDPVLASPLAAAAQGGGGSLGFTGGGGGDAAAAPTADPMTKVLDAVAKGGVGPLAGLKAPAGVQPIMPSGSGPALPGRTAMQGSPVAALIQAMLTGQGGGGNPALALRLGQALSGGR